MLNKITGGNGTELNGFSKTYSPECGPAGELWKRIFNGVALVGLWCVTGGTVFSIYEGTTDNLIGRIIRFDVWYLFTIAGGGIRPLDLKSYSNWCLSDIARFMLLILLFLTAGQFANTRGALCTDPLTNIVNETNTITNVTYSERKTKRIFDTHYSNGW